MVKDGDGNLKCWVSQVRSGSACQTIYDLQFRMNIEQIDSYLELWDNNKLRKVVEYFKCHSQIELAFAITWMTTMM